MGSRQHRSKPPPPAAEPATKREPPKRDNVKRALLVERLGGPLNVLTGEMERLGYEVLRASDPGAVRGLVGSLRRLSLVVVNGDSFRADPARLVGSIKEHHPDLPVLWLQANRAAAPAKVDYAAADVERLTARIGRMARETFYSQNFVRAVVAAAQAVLTDFGAPAVAAEPGVRSSLSVVSELTAFIFFYGPGLSGHILFTATAGDVASVYRSQFRGGPAGNDDVEDFLGEMTNRISGQIKRCIDPDAGECHMGLPYFIRGEGTSFRYKAGTPTLSIDLTSGERKFHVELCLYRFDHGMIRGVENASHMEPGVVNFL